MIDFIGGKPWDHQVKAVQLTNARDIRGQYLHPDLMLIWEMGTGKTRATIDILRSRFADNRRVMRTLILGPIIVVENWRREIAKFSRINPHDVVPLVGSEKKRIREMTDAVLDPATMTNSRAKILITNYEAMQMKELYAMLQAWAPEVIICDESQRLKNPKSKRAKAVATLAPCARHRYLLSGTPILNSAMDVFQQYLVLDSGKTFGDNFFVFQRQYFEDRNSGMPAQKHFPKWEARRETYEILSHKIYKKAVRVVKSECLDLPPLVRQKLFVELGVDQKRMYEEMKNEYITWVKAHENSPEPRAVVAQMALTKALRLQQIASGYAKTEDGTEIPIKDNPRLAALRELLEDHAPEHKIIVWATFKENYRQIAKVCEELKLGYTELHGDVSASEKNQNMDRFRSDPGCRVIIANQQAAGIGVNLVESDISIFFSRNFSLEQDLQAEARNYRGGSEQHAKVTRIDLVATGTIDELILEALAGKANIAEQILTWKDQL
jgi:SNF2 family DNA or RNA helicase